MCCQEHFCEDRQDALFQIRWFRENTAGTVETLGGGIPIFRQSWTDLTSRYQNRAFLNQPYSPSLLGKYWCQVINTTADPDQPLMRSNVFTLLAPGTYNESTCSKIQSADNITCADLSDNQTTSLDPTQQTSTELTPSSINCTATSEFPSTNPIPSDVIVYAGVSGGVLLVIVITQQVIIVILIVMKRRSRKTVGQATAAGQCITVCDHYSTVGSVLQVMITIQ